jgi:hypothetical protein
VALVVGLAFVRPLGTGPIGFDTAASVLHFDRIVQGRYLESFVTATPKPLLTAVDGTLMAVVGDWRAVSIATIIAFAGCVVLGAWFAWRLAGPVAAAFVAVTLLGSRGLLLDVGAAYALAWALLLWLVAGLAVTSAQARPVLAGIALAGAFLARPETAVIIGAATVAVFIAGALARRSGRPFDRRWWGVLAGWAAVPILLLHDWRLTGDPWFWTTVAARYSAAAPEAVRGPLEVATDLAGRVLSMPISLVLAAIGIAWLVRRRWWAPAIGLVAVIVGIAGFLVLLAARGIYVSDRYASAMEVGILVAAGVGLGAVAASLAPSLAGRSPRTAGGAVAVVVIGAVVGLAAIWPPASLDGGARGAMTAQRRLTAHADRAVPVLACALERIPGARDRPPPDTSLAGTVPEDVVLVVPSQTRPRLGRDLHVSLGLVAGLRPEIVDPATGLPTQGRLFLLDRRADAAAEAFATLQVDRPATIGDVRLTPLLADAEVGLWVVAIDRPGQAPADLRGCAEVEAGLG